ncbi:MAG: chlorophyll synthase ChlG [Chloroflexales bacterium]|nr:chlorophyll synthase ChlG [Chloroflexales bacterium]
MSNLPEGSGTVTSQSPPTATSSITPRVPRHSVLLQRTIALMKPVTWFAPAWAFLCGALASGGLGLAPETIGRLVLGLLMAGPILCGLSQVVNDFCDQEVDAINEPHRLIPAGLVSLRHIQIVTVGLTWIGTSIALFLGREVALFVGVGLIFALMYSMKPVRAKRNGWIGNTLVAFSYEGLAWLAGHAAFGALTWQSVVVATLYSVGAHGIMTVNDFKSMHGDAQMGIQSIPVQYGKRIAAQLVVATMALAQIGVIGALLWWGHPIAASVILLLLLIQTVPYTRFLRDPEHNAVFFNATAIMLFVWGMIAAAIGLAA